MDLTITDSALRTAGVLLLAITTIEVGGLTLLRMVRGAKPASELQTTFWRAGHAHAGVLVLLALVALLYVDAARLDGVAQVLGGRGIAVSALAVPGGFFFSVPTPETEAPNRFIWLTYAGAALLAISVAVLGIGLLAA